ncbi:hypothetical protein TPB0596_42060 [Tsukamurella pulmonis]|uniref:tyrosine-type recombinase/integrase n=1 Tax=Tsukamurella pulmonis TaxID=47312 RepID=UPI001EE08ADB|nr:tyrosine-type recombinase/integrase [Tsukamurella pulmonis]BDD84443.1 hypothetical protein TPB0596_42060 [Tsukamurella pulmonis]
MGRPKLEIGTYGNISVTELPSGRWQARTRYRDKDGVTRPVKANGTTAARAKAALRGQLAKRRRGPAGTDGELTPESTVSELLAYWLAVCRADTALALKNGGRPKKTGDTLDGYGRCVEKVVLPGLREVKLRELNTQRVDGFLRAQAAVSAARDARTVLSQACKLAVAYGVMDYSPVSAAYSPPRSAKKPRALTPEDAVEMRNRIIAWQEVGSKLGPARGYDRLRIFDVLLATGARIGEVLALVWDDVDGLDSDGPVTVHIGARLDAKSKRVEGRKAGGDPYTITLPEFGAQALREQRALGIPFAPVFPTRVGTHQSEANVRTHWRAIRGTDMDWVVPHTVRKTVVTAIERELGLEAAARQAGHSSSEITRRHYVERSVTVPDYSGALDEYSRPIRALRVVKQEQAG